MDTIKDKLPDVQEIKLVSENEDKTKKYMITAAADADLRKSIFEIFAKEGITIFEMKKSDATLEDAFMQLIDSQNQNEEETKADVEVKEEVVTDIKEENAENKDNQENSTQQEESAKVEETEKEEVNSEGSKEENKQEEGGQE